jgi:hypothetical protein
LFRMMVALLVGEQSGSELGWEGGTASLARDELDVPTDQCTSTYHSYRLFVIVRSVQQVARARTHNTPACDSARPLLRLKKIAGIQ